VSLSPEERISIDNGIWLCHNCAKLIDSDVSRYSVAILRYWRAQAETAAAERLGRTVERPASASPGPMPSIEEVPWEFDRLKRRVLFEPVVTDRPPLLRELREFLIDNDLVSRPTIKPFFDRWLSHFAITQGIRANNVFSEEDWNDMWTNLAALRL
jgi:hypothetical protein